MSLHLVSSLRNLQVGFFGLPFLSLIVIISVGCSQSGEEPADDGQANGEEAAQETPNIISVFAEGEVSTFAQEQSLAFTASGDSCVYVRSGNFQLAVKSNNDAGWRNVGVLTEIRPSIDHSGSFGPDGNFYFSANERKAGSMEGRGFDLFMIRRTEDGWSQPEALNNLNSSASEYSPSFDADGSLYFASDRGESGDFNIYRAQYVSGRFLQPLKLSDKINSSDDESSVALSPTGQGILFTRATRNPPSAAGNHDLYFSYQKGDVWQEAQLVHPLVNGDYDSFLPSFSPDGLTVYFTSARPLDSHQEGGRRSFSSIFSISTVDMLNRAVQP